MREPRILALPGVYRPRSDTALLAEALRLETIPPGARLLDVCTGTGALALSAAACGVRDVTAVDLSRRAALNARLNARLNGHRLRVCRGDLFAPVAGRRFHLIVANPPYLPAPGDPPARGPERAWDAGPDGRAVLDRICAGAPDHLRPGGALLLVQSSLAAVARSAEMLAAAGLEVGEVTSRRGPLGPIARARAEDLRTRGALAPGSDEERLVVLRARAPRRRPAHGVPAVAAAA